MTRKVLILFPDEWDRAAVRDPRIAARYEFFHEGFDLFRFPENARLFAFDALAFADRVARRYAGGRIDAVVTSDEQFGTFLASLVARALGLPHTPLEAILVAQHKHYARRAFARIAPEASVRHGLIRWGFERPAEVPMRFPFYVKPSKAAYSVLARRVDSFAELHAHTRFGRLEAAIIERLVQPFAQVMRACSALDEDPLSMVCEELVPGRQVTANGFARAGRVTMLGTVDSIMYPGTDQFQRFQYPSTLAPGQLEAVDALAVRVVEGLGFRDGFFNIEMRIDPADGTPRLIEMNPRVAGQFFDLFERVDGYSLFEAVIDVHSGRDPVVRRGAGRDRHAASFVLRDLSGEGLARWPSAAELAELQRRHPEAHTMVYAKRGADLAREMKWLGSYRYGTVNLGAATLEELFARFHRICADITFHPRGHRQPDVSLMLAEAAAGDD